MEQLKFFTNTEYSSIRIFNINNEPWFVGKDVCNFFGDSNHNRTLGRLDDNDRKKIDIKDSLGRTQKNTVLINESGLYAVLFSMQPTKAHKDGSSYEYPIKTQERIDKIQKFKHWVTSEVLPTIRKTGGYVHNDDLFISTYLPFADEATKALFRTTLLTIREQNQLITTQKNKISAQESVITTLTKDVSLADLRHILNRLMRHHGGNFQNRWQLLYREFEHKYSMNLSVRLQNYNKHGKKKITSKLDYIDKVLNQLPDLYDLAAKIFESDLKELINELYEARGLKND